MWAVAPVCPVFRWRSARPDLDVTTLDSNGKKTRFQQQVRIELGLDNLTVINGRVEQVEAAPFRHDSFTRLCFHF